MRHIEQAALDRLQAKALVDRVTRLGIAAQKKYGDQVFEGDCGQWAWALHKYLNDPRCKIGLMTERTKAKTVRELDDYEPYVFHVWVEYEGMMFDASGQIDDDYLMDFMEGYEGADDTQTWENLTADEPLRQLISGSTKWKHEWPTYYKLFEQVEKKAPKAR